MTSFYLHLVALVAVETHRVRSAGNPEAGLSAKMF